MKRTILAIVSAGMAVLIALVLCACNSGGSADGDSAGANTAGGSTTISAAATTRAQRTVTGSSVAAGSSAATPASAADPLAGAFTLTLYADFSGSGEPEERILTHDISLPLENEPASPSLIAFALADGLTEWTGLDFKINDVTLDADSITVDWSADSTLITGLDGSEPGDSFVFPDDVSLNWFMMDSLARTLKNNFDVATVYYNSAGGPVAFTNPDEMAARGLRELPVDQPYEGSAFFIAHSGGMGDPAVDEDVPEWWGEYRNEDAFASLGITNFDTNYDGVSFFLFSIYSLRDGHEIYSGVASIISDDRLTAEYAEFLFTLSEDYKAVNISVDDGSEWAHLAGLYEWAGDDYQYPVKLAFGMEGLDWTGGDDYTLDGDVSVYSDILGGDDFGVDGDGIRARIEVYLSYRDIEVSEWRLIANDMDLSAQTTYPVWVAEYYTGYNEDTNLCADMVVLVSEDYALYLHTVRDADLDMNSDIDFAARIRELFETVSVEDVS